MKDLIAELERAEVGSRELDTTIAYHIGYGEPIMREAFEKFGPTAFKRPWGKDRHGRKDFGKSPYQNMRFGFQESVLLVGEDNRLVNAPEFTTSLDAARTLVPEGWITTIDHYCLADNPKENIWRAWLRKLQGNLVEEDDPIYLIIMFGSAPTPALALCIAALKARQGDAK